MVGSKLQTVRDAGSGYKAPTPTNASGTTAANAKKTATVKDDVKAGSSGKTNASGVTAASAKAGAGVVLSPTNKVLDNIVKSDVAAGSNRTIAPTATQQPVAKSSYTPSAPVTPSGSSGSSSYVPPTPPSVGMTGIAGAAGASVGAATGMGQQQEQMPQQPQIQMNEQQQQMQSDAITSVDTIMSGYQQLQADAKSMGNEGLVALAAQWDKMSQMLDGIQAQIVGQIQGQMNGNDPAMQNALKLIRDEADRMRKETLDELNARGLVQSGVYAKALSDMNNNELTQSQSAIASRFGDLQTQLNNAIMSLAQTRISALGANQNAVASMLTNTQNNVLTAGLSGLNSAVSLRGQDIQNSQFNQQLAQNNSQFNQQMGYNYAGLNQNQSQFDSTMKYNYAGLNQNQSQFNSTMQYNRDKMAQDNQQFYDQLSQADKQFYAQMSSSEKMGFAQIAATQGNQAAANSVAQQRLDWEKKVYGQERTDAQNANTQSNTYTQVGNAMSPGGFVESSIRQIVAGSATVGQISNTLKASGYTADAQSAIMNMIQQDPNVQKKLAPTTSAGSTYVANPAYDSSSYVPSWWK